MSSSGTIEGTTPLYGDRYVVNCMAASAITVGQTVQVVSGWNFPSFRVAPITGPAQILFGVALTAQATAGDPVSIVSRGIVRAIVDEEVTPGALIAASSGARVLASTAVEATSNGVVIRGVALSYAQAAGSAVYVALF